MPAKLDENTNQLSSFVRKDMDGKSVDVTEQLLSQLQDLIPSAFTEGKLDISRLKLALGKNGVNQEAERYHLNWAGKAEAYRILQEPTTSTLRPEPEKSLNFETANHLFIEGENLQVLKVLQKAYFGKVKMIYIDPPYNTGNDSFIYPDRFSQSKEEYLKRIDELDDNGELMREGFFRRNSKENGHYHSNWLSMMLPRLYLARNLLRDDGAIFVSIDDNEVHNLRLLMDEVFGAENFVTQFCWKRRTGANDSKSFYVTTDHEYIICFAKSEKFAFLGIEKNLNNYTNPDNDPRGAWASDNLTCNKTAKERPNLYYPITDPKTGITYECNINRVWAYEKDRMNRIISEGKVIFPKNDNGSPMYKRHLSELRSSRKPVSSWILTPNEKGNDSTVALKFPLNMVATKQLRELLGGQFFDFPKSYKSIQEIIAQTTESTDIILDFFSGSGTTAQAVLELNQEDGGNRQFICIQLSEKCAEDSEAYKAGYQTIADICRERIQRVIQKLQQDSDLATSKTNNLGFKSFKLASSNFKQWRGDIIESPQDLAEQMQIFIQTKKPNAKFLDMAYELLLKNGQPMTSQITTLTIDNQPIISANNHEFLFVLSDMSKNMLQPLVALKPKEIIFLDSVFHNSDDLKVNTQLQLNNVHIKFTSI